MLHSNRKNTYAVLTMVLVCILCLSMLAGCSSSASSSPSGSPTETAAATSAAKNTLVVGIAKEPDKLDPQNTTSHYARQVNCNIYDNLIDKDQDGKYVAGLAESWKASDDKLVYTFNLRHGVKFHNGEELKASDVAFTFTRGIGCASSKFFYSCVKEAKAIDDYTVSVTLNYASAIFEELLTLPQMGILNEKAVTDGGQDYVRNPVGTGAYMISEWQSGQSIKFAAFEDCWKGPAKIPSLEFRIVTDTSTGMIALENGEIDAFYDMTSVDKQAAQANKNLVYEETVATSYEQVVLNNEDPLLSDVNVRRAIAYAIDKESIVTVATNGSGILADSQISPSMPGYSENVKAYPYDVDKAKECLAASAYPNGFECTLKINSGYREKIAQIIQADLAEIGITLKIDVQEFASVTESLTNGTFTMALVGRNLHLNDPTLSTDNNFNSKYLGSGGNYQRYSNPQVDEWLAQTFTETDEAKRNELFENILTALHDDAANVPLYWMPWNVVYNANLKNIGISGCPYYDLSVVSW